MKGIVLKESAFGDLVRIENKHYIRVEQMYYSRGDIEKDWVWFGPINDTQYNAFTRLTELVQINEPK